MLKNGKNTVCFRWILVIAGLVVVGQVLSACAPQKNSSSLYTQPITIGLVEAWPGYLALYVAEEKGYFKEAGLDVHLKGYAGLTELSQDYVSGKLPMRANINLDAVQEHLKGLKHKLVTVMTYSQGADAILASKDIATLSDFKGKRVAYEAGTLEEFFLVWALNETGLKLSDIIPVQATPEEAARFMQEGKVDVAVSYEPFTSKALAAGNCHVVYSTAYAPYLIGDVFTVRQDFLDAHPETVEALLGAYFKAIEFRKTNPDEAYAITAKYIGDTPEGVAKQLQTIHLLDVADNRTSFTFSTGLQSLYGNLREVGKFLRNQEKGTPKAVETDSLIERKFIQKLS